MSGDLKERALASPVHVSLTMPDTEENAAVLGEAAGDLVDRWLGEIMPSSLLILVLFLSRLPAVCMRVHAEMAQDHLLIFLPTLACTPPPLRR